MASERQLQETVARCIDNMVFYHNGHRTPKAKALMVAGVRTDAGRVAGLNLSDKKVDEHVLRPVRDGLHARYGPSAGGRLFTEFLEAFDGLPGPVPVPRRDPVLSPSKV
jgi:hypothetical protein